MTDSESILNAIRAEVLPKLATIAANQNNLAQKLDDHIAAGAGLRSTVAEHEKSIQRVRGVGAVLHFIWALILAGIYAMFSTHSPQVK